ncbi:ATP-binding protein [Propionicimonas sp.]|uniref:sensor histidine kinase n=1 Tax=Propionicimonas sp. TaxID=1955623 RepID=UPI0017C3FA1A|nr:ATP-binding protein [Propionicimonas sp.]MBU3976126.1 HAMP domain-containing protein [Actinomycetota bacterium]MBA3020938.1 HAMP domain-containing histidine kinase [Propionicimonas sp.]MBU3985316.1 HAMP domain-containing protein [Actinomycetota bacterium]MBU4008306.1 HAMP domain-containing protein [Actinomycetota bacterium]MBU4064480.1 HAMP domain-containing protein [Actinomycetota bacterium]
MNRLSVRLVISHVLVALIGGAATFAVVRWLAPALFDESLRLGPAGGSGRGPGTGQGQGSGGVLRDQFAAAIDQALLIGAVVGVAAAAIFGVFAARRVIRSLGTVRAATRELAKGRYDLAVPEPKEAELAELAADVNQLGAALAQTETTRMRLLGEVAHELRTPLTVIDGYVEAMIDGVLPTSPENLEQISDETRRLRRLGEDLSSLSRAEEGRLGLQLASADVGALAVAAAERLRPQAVDAGVKLEVHSSAAGLIASVDADRIAQVVTNLVGNALGATDAGGTITVTARAEASQVLIEVTDTGVGLAPDQLEKIFERFYRVTGILRQAQGTESHPNPSSLSPNPSSLSLSKGQTGSGIGLTISRGIVRAHGGELTASSAGLGRGATFTLRLPLAQASSRA